MDEHPDAPNPEIAEALMISQSDVSVIRIRVGRPAKRTAAQMDELCERYKRFMADNPKAKCKTAAEVLGVSRDMMSYIRRKLGVATKRSKAARTRLRNKIQRVLTENPHLSNRELAEAVGRAKTTVVKLRSELGMNRDPQQARDFLFVSVGQQVRKLVLDRGMMMSDAELAERVGVAKSTLKRWLRKLGVPTGKQRKFGMDEKFFRKMWADGWSDGEIARVMGCGCQRVQKWRTRNNLVSNVIHHSLRMNAVCRSHTPATLLDVVGSPTGVPRLDKVWAFAALGADTKWLKRRFPDATWQEINEVVSMLLEWPVPRHLKKIIRRKQLGE